MHTKHLRRLTAKTPKSELETTAGLLRQPYFVIWVLERGEAGLGRCQSRWLTHTDRCAGSRARSTIEVDA